MFLIRFFFLLAISATFALGQPANTFFSTFDAERGNTFAPARDGNIWLGGMRDERVLLVKMTTGGNVLDKHTLDFKGNGFDSESLVEIFEDSDGSIVGCGNFETDNLGRGFVFRYNPSSRTVLWARIVRSESYNVLYGITPIGPNGDYLLYGSPQFVNIDDVELQRLDRATGQVKLVQRFGLKGPDQLNRIIYHKGALYGCGRFSNGLGFNFNNNTRHALCKLDTATLKPLWTRIGPLASSKEAQLQGRDILVDNNTLISTFSGNATGTELTQSTIFLQKTDLNGKQLWVKQYNLPEWNSEFAETVVSVPDGYFLFGQDLLGDTSRLFLLKTDKQGNPLRAVKIDFYANDELAQIAPRAAILPTGSGLFFTATSQNQSGQFQAILGKTDFDGRLEGNCAFLKSTPVNLQPLPSPVSELVVPEPSTGNTQLTPIIPSLENPDVEFSPKCSSPGTCPNLPDLRLRMDSIRCINGEARLYYSFCNTGAQEYTGSAFFGLYDKNPFKEEAQLITTIIHTGNKLLPGDCVQGSVSSSFTPPDIFQLDTFKQLYAVMGINLNTKTPIKISDFPFSPNRAECGYFNNMDSLSLPEQLCKKGKGQPDLTLRVNRTFCSADSTLFFKARVCNLGDSTVNGPISFAFYDKNPLKEKANAVWSTTVSQTLAPGECKEHTFPLPAAVLPFPKLFSFMGAGSNTPTPISLTDFPLPQSPVESDYLNNLDSFVVKAPECSDCERPNTFIKSMGVANKEELLQSMCVASNGYVYMVGRQSDNGLIAKTKTRSKKKPTLFGVPL